MIKILPPKSYGTIKPLANSQGQPLRCTPPAPDPGASGRGKSKKRRRLIRALRPVYRLRREPERTF